MTQTMEAFEELFIPRKDYHSNAASLYRVYRDSKHFEVVEAGSVLDALAASTIKNPYKVQRHDPLGVNILHFGYTMSMEAQNSDATQQIEKVIVPENMPQAITEQVVSAAEGIAIPPVDQPLSNDDVNKLLNS